MEMRRCSSWCANPGQRRARVRVVVVMPSTIVNVRRTIAMSPLARVAYQSKVELMLLSPMATR
jgi:hypothetical protein